MLDDKGNEYRVNQYQIRFLWPFLQPSDRREYRRAELAKLAKKAVAFFESIDAIGVRTLWLKLKRKFRNELVSGYHLARLLSAEDPQTYPLTPELIYAAHRWLATYEHYFKPSTIYGFEPRTADEVNLLLKRYLTPPSFLHPKPLITT